MKQGSLVKLQKIKENTRSIIDIFQKASPFSRAQIDAGKTSRIISSFIKPVCFKFC